MAPGSLPGAVRLLSGKAPTMVTLNVRRTLAACACAAVCVVSGPAGMALAEGSLPPDPSVSPTVAPEPSVTPTVSPEPTPSPSATGPAAVTLDPAQFEPMMWAVGALVALSLVSVVGSWSR